MPTCFFGDPSGLLRKLGLKVVAVSEWGFSGYTNKLDLTRLDRVKPTRSIIFLFVDAVHTCITNAHRIAFVIPFDPTTHTKNSLLPSVLRDLRF